MRFKRNSKTKNGKIVAVSSITIISDVVRNIGGDKVETRSICGVGIDPHTYKAKPNDPRVVSESDIVFINGFALEHWIEEMVRNAGGNKKVVTVTAGITPMTDEKGYGDPDPHAWFNVLYVKTYAVNIEKALSELDKPNEAYYKQNLESYLKKLDSLDGWIKSEIQKIPPKKRLLITSHDAFRYFGLAYGLEVKGLQGISTEAKAQTEDIKKLVDMIKERGLNAVFIETSVNPKLLEEISKETGAKIGGTLYSDSVGDEGTFEGTYIGAVTHNVNAVVNALKQ
jgi:ABC-type Zn uptake system ZnuABC Zn-binding protein ZnuA